MAHILVTRPQEKSKELAIALKDFGFKTSIQPMLQIDKLELSEQQLAPLSSADIVIFVSQDAVRHLHQVQADLPQHSICLAVGKSTADLVHELFGKTCLKPIVETSEGLLAMAELNEVAQKNIVLVKGQGGRAKLATELKVREAILHPISVYKRYANPALSSEMVKQWQADKVEAVILTSNASIDAFMQLELPTTWLNQLTVFVVSERCEAYLKQQKQQVKHVINCQGADNKSILNAINRSKLNPQEQAMESEKDITAKSKVSDKAPNQSSTKAQNVAESTPKGNAGNKVVAWLALLVSVAAVGAVGYGYTLYLQQQQALTDLTQQNAELQQLLVKNQKDNQAKQLQVERANSQLSEQIAQAELTLNEQISQQLAQVKQQAPELNSEEVKSLYRMAEFKAQVQGDYLGAAAMLMRLDVLLENFTGTSQVRSAIHADIQALKATKVVDSQAIYLRLDGLIANLAKLDLNMVELPEVAEQAQQQALSDDVNDWQANLKRSWHLLVDDFIKIRKRKAAVEPLLSVEEQALIRHQLRFNLMQAQTALVTKQAEIFISSLVQGEQILATYYDQQDEKVRYLMQQLKQLAKTQLEFSPAVSFSSEPLIKDLV